MKTFPLYNIPYLVRDPNDFHMSAARHAIEVRNQTVVDDYFIARDQGLSALDARKQVAAKHHMTSERVYVILKWFCNQARKRKKFDFLTFFALSEEH